MTGAAVGAATGAAVCGAGCAKLGALAGGIAGLIGDVHSSSTTPTHHDSIGRPVYAYAPGVGGAAQLYVVNDLSIPHVVLDVRIDGRLRASDIQFGEHHIIGAESFGTVPSKRYIVYIIGRNAGTTQIVGSRVYCISVGHHEPVAETILLRVGRLDPPGYGGESCR
ncbi:MAG: hypothetical protein Q8R39_00355 [bacterium]|nr:hypothetical protein [bacterium]MDZ4284862.1 hypothetical protein [Patescibacteria group bacterium]